MFWIKLKIQNLFSNYIAKRKTEKILEEVKDTSKVNIFLSLLFKALVLITFGFIIFVPFYIMVIIAVAPDSQANDVLPIVYPKSVNVDSFNRALSDDYWPALGWTTLITFVSVIVKIFFSATFGYAFSLKKWRFKKLSWIFFLSILILPEVALLIGQYRTIIILEWEREPVWLALALMMPFAASVFSGYMFRNAFEAIPDRIKEASMVDGCSGIKYFFKIALPMITPTIWTVGILTAFAAWNSFLWPLLLLLGKDSPIKLINIYLLDVGINPDHDSPIGTFKNVKMAGAILAILPMFIAYFLFRKRILNAISRQGSTIKG
ncbi:carbohydrate ABC transporter permease [Mesomycoplasma neurolyticum]|uniref:Inner membrane ABC transporter permease protein ycjP n=1 Tax=Mesomycoplasma neurolyticum TaxID=2120 RepID=A0A449A5X5_9BACT|nr:carbohydrate ABC transporter permease [Mesomycoplasma neurolyticum]VEU59622.1 Inner membrane ABC transporter permease protein ycjP [Mesomycoplasma neurolyticum]